MIKKTLYLYEYIGMYSVAYNNLYNKQLVNKIGKFQSIQSNKSGYVDPYQEPIYLPLKTITAASAASGFSLRLRENNRLFGR